MYISSSNRQGGAITHSFGALSAQRELSSSTIPVQRNVSDGIMFPGSKAGAACDHICPEQKDLGYV